MNVNLNKIWDCNLIPDTGGGKKDWCVLQIFLAQLQLLQLTREKKLYIFRQFSDASESYSQFIIVNCSEARKKCVSIQICYIRYVFISQMDSCFILIESVLLNFFFFANRVTNLHKLVRHTSYRTLFSFGGGVSLKHVVFNSCLRLSYRHY